MTTEFKTLDKGPEITLLKELNLLASYMALKPLSKITQKDIERAAQFVNSVRNIKVREQSITDITRDMIITQTIKEYQVSYANPTYPHNDPNGVIIKNVKEEVDYLLIIKNLQDNLKSIKKELNDKKKASSKKGK